MQVLVTGGAGYIGSHTILELLRAELDVIAVDNLSNSKEVALQRVAQISGRSFACHNIDLRDGAALNMVFEEYDIEAVIHLAGLKVVDESIQQPLDYYDNNLMSTLRLCEVMAYHDVKKLLFSSSAMVYGEPQSVPISEDSPRDATSPYGMTKIIIEDILADLYAADKTWEISLLRYFNPAGADKSGLIGEDPKGVLSSLLPYVSQVAIGNLPRLCVFGNDYPTKDGTGIRDYVHVSDLAEAHLAALYASEPGVEVYNLGTGKGYSVLQVIEAFSNASARPVPYNIAKRRSGDVPASYADTTKAKTKLGWRATRGLAEICEDTWRWQSQNPNGYEVYSVKVNKNIQA